MVTESNNYIVLSESNTEQKKGASGVKLYIDGWCDARSAWKSGS
jgi:hypothetical protein